MERWQRATAILQLRGLLIGMASDMLMEAATFEGGIA
jgi:hypothetical protein